MFSKKNDTQKYDSRIWRLVSDVKLYHVLESYKVGLADITITTSGNYIISEPALNTHAESAYNTIFEHMSNTATPIIDYQNVSESQVLKSFQVSADILNLSDILQKNYSPMVYYLIRDVLGFRVIDVLMNDPDIEDITCENEHTPVGVLHRRYPEFFVMDTNIKFENADMTPDNKKISESRNSIDTFTKTLMQLTGNYATSVAPYVEGSTVNRDRLSAFGSYHVTPDGPSFTIRRFPEKPVTIINLIQDGVIPVQAAAYVWSIFSGNGTGMIVGNTGSGKTTILNAMLSLVNKRWKVILIEDTEEVRVPQRHALRLKTRASTDSFNRDYRIGIGDLLSYSLRQRPQFVVVGEVRLADVPILFQVFETGHASLSTFHASSPQKALTRLEAKPIEIMAAQKDDLWFLFHVGRVLENGVFRRKMLALNEVYLNDETRELEMIQVMGYNTARKEFTGTDIRDIVSKSHRLQYASSLNGIDDDGDIAADMNKKIQCLQNVNNDKTANHRDVMNQIYDMYEQE